MKNTILLFVQQKCKHDEMVYNYGFLHPEMRINMFFWLLVSIVQPKTAWRGTSTEYENFLEKVDVYINRVHEFLEFLR